MDKIRELIDELRLNKCSIKLNEMNNINLILEDGTQLSEVLVQKIRANKSELVDYLKFSLQKVERKIKKVETQLCYPISDGQRRLWILNQFEENGISAYNMPNKIHIKGDYDLDSFKRAIHSVIDRHEILRTVFKEDENGEVKQWILNKEDLKFQIQYIDYRGQRNVDEKVNAYISEDAHKPFSLKDGPLLRASLLQIGDEAYVFYYNMHHIIGDEWSMDVLSNDVFKFYEAFKENVKPQLNELKIQYKDYSSWQLAQLEEETFRAHRDYWLSNLNGELTRFDLPGTKLHLQKKGTTGQMLNTSIDPLTSEKLKKYSESNGGSLFMTLLAAWNILMYRYTGQTDIIVGTPTAGRDHPDLVDQIGFYINMLVLRNNVRPEENFNTFYDSVKNNTLKSYSHQAYPFDRLVEELNLVRDINRSPIFDVLLDFHNSDDSVSSEHLDSKQGGDLNARKAIIKYDLELHFTETKNGILLHIGFNEDVYEKENIINLVNHFKNLITNLIESPNAPIGKIDFLSAHEKKQLLFEFNNTASTIPDKTVLDLFELQVKKNPANIAIANKSKNFTYEELDALSNQLADCLIKDFDVKKNDLVGILLDKSVWAIVSMLGVLKTGAAYVPIDPQYPSSRKQYIVKETSLKLVISESIFKNDIDYYNGSVFIVDVEFDKEKYSKQSINKISSGSNLAYVIYTSGSTGIPKGVMIEHASFTNYLNWAKGMYAVDESKSLDFGLFTSLSFDLTITSIYLPLISGGTLYVFDVGSDVSTLLKLYLEHNINCIKLTPAHISLIGSLSIERSSVQVAIVGGDALTNQQVEILQSVNPDIRIFNEYGPTESTVGCIVKKIFSSKEHILIGKPISNTAIYILNEQEALQPRGVTGEICIGGLGLGRGYLNQTSKTNEKFIKNPFKPEEKIYKTGDLGRWLPDGNLEYLGRKDNQVKISGYRVELGEIEQALLKRTSIEEALVLVKENQSNEKELVAYITGKSEQSTQELRSFLKDILPEYMIPAHYVQLEKMPLNSNGKIDRKLLPHLEEFDLANKLEYVTAEGDTETKLVTIWQEILGRTKIGVTTSFFNLGGTSIKIIRMQQMVNRIFQTDFSVTFFFENLTIRAIGSVIDKTDLNAKTEDIQVEKEIDFMNF